MSQTTDYANIRVALENKLRELLNRIENIEADLSEPHNDDWEERAKEVEDDDVLSAVSNFSIDEVEQIKAAIHQIDVGRYGTCVSCGKKIAAARLEALPFVTTCIQCA